MRPDLKSLTRSNTVPENIKNMQYDRIYPIRRKEHLSDALLRAGVKFIPNNCIINKRIPGIGATHFELTSPRKSIIIEPNVPVIENKSRKHEHCLAVMQGVTVTKIMHFLEEYGNTNYKLLTTPESFFKIKEAMEKLEINMYKDCFMLFDECEKLVQDVDFRNSIKLPIDDFFRFDSKAMISATPIIANDIRFRHFTKVLIKPEYEYRLPLNIIQTNNITLALSELLVNKRQKVCIFCNSIDSINSFFRLIPRLQDSCTYCSKDGIEKLYAGKRRDKSVFISEPGRHNFFTSRFFSAVDIECEPPHVVIISDLHGATQSTIDPKTEAIQIAGRFRNGVRSLTHITTIDPNLEYQEKEETDNWLQGAGELYKQWGQELETSHNDGKRTLLREAISNNSYTRFLDENAQIDPFLIANYYEEQAVRKLYTDINLLLEAYQKADYFLINYEEKNFDISDDERLAIQRIVSLKTKYEWLLRKFEQIAYLKTNKDKKMQARHHQLLQGLLNSEGEQNLYRCYSRFGAEYVRTLELKDKAIREAIGAAPTIIIKNSPKAKALFAKRFETGKEYSPTEIKVMMNHFYNELNIEPLKHMTAKEIEKFARIEEYRGHNGRIIRIKEIL